MTSQGLVFLICTRRRDGQWIHYRTCDEAEARRVAERFGAEVEVIEK